MSALSIRSMAENPDWIAPCAVWWHRQWGELMGYSVPGAVAAISELTQAEGRQAALVALMNDVPIGSVFLVHRDLDSHAHLQPWLAGLFVLPPFRHAGIGQALASAAVAEAARLLYDRVYLYTVIGEFYRRQGWRAYERIMLHGVEHEIMTMSSTDRQDASN